MKGKGLSVKDFRKRWNTPRHITLPECQLEVQVRRASLLDALVDLREKNDETKQLVSMILDGQSMSVKGLEPEKLKPLRNALRTLALHVVVYPPLVDFDTVAQEEKDEVGVDILPFEDLLFLLGEVNGDDAVTPFPAESETGSDSGQHGPELSDAPIADSGS